MDKVSHWQKVIIKKWVPVEHDVNLEFSKLNQKVIEMTGREESQDKITAYINMHMKRIRQLVKNEERNK